MTGNLELIAVLFEDSGSIPNNRRLPLVLYRGAFHHRVADPASALDEIYRFGHWHAAWRYSVYNFPHYHSTAHEVLGCYRGTASVRFGHTKGITLSLEPGDVVIIPAGVGHQSLGASDDFHVVGGYPDGQSADLLRGLASERPLADANIARVPLPRGDPIFGENGPLLEHWRAA